ncbi:uncharacterized protein LOC6584573 [Drosophila mojavensis]|uniref:RAI1-like domain-containing protein n=1 Tax=Drosophila mojavensis TaxID=7230 RepID=B4L4R6_DROMO|nr:uncharacterized protein LOC6584573 [Drosophila mojavensis]EDW07544.2 uncharacterized protein Dmoj_GI14811 [Drosophila mojavensis]
MAQVLCSLASDLPWKLTDLQMVHVFCSEGRTYSKPTTLGYYRAPSDREFPLDMVMGFKSFVRYENRYSGNGMHLFNYIMQLERPLSVLEHVDICTSSGTLLKMMCQNDFTVLATRYRNTIYLKTLPLPNYLIKSDSSCLFKLRQYLYVDEPGDMPNMNACVDLNKQNIGTFTAKLGKFRLLYTAEVFGVQNTEPLGDLDDPEVLKQCRLSSVRLYPHHAPNWRRNYRMKRWLLNAYLAGIEEMQFAPTKRGMILKPITIVNVESAIKEQPWSLSESLQTMHLLLTEISKAMVNIDCPHTTFIFNLRDSIVTYRRIYGKSESSFLVDRYVRFLSELE